MASPLDILLRVKGDSSDAVKAVKQVGTEADQTAQKVSGIGTKLGGVATFLAAGAGGFIGAMAGNIASGIGDAMQAGIDRAVGRIQQNLQQPTSGADIVNQLQAIPQTKYGLKAAPARFLNYLFNPQQSLTDIVNRIGGYNPSVEDQLAAFSALPLEQQQAALATGRLGGRYYRAYEAAANRATDNAAFQVTINAGVGDPNAIGRQLRSSLDLRDRNNGRYQTTLTRRG